MTPAESVAFLRALDASEGVVAAARLREAADQLAAAVELVGQYEAVEDEFTRRTPALDAARAAYDAAVGAR